MFRSIASWQLLGNGSDPTETSGESFQNIFHRVLIFNIKLRIPSNAAHYVLALLVIPSFVICQEPQKVTAGVTPPPPECSAQTCRCCTICRRYGSQINENVAVLHFKLKVVSKRALEQERLFSGWREMGQRGPGGTHWWWWWWWWICFAWGWWHGWKSCFLSARGGEYVRPGFSLFLNIISYFCSLLKNVGTWVFKPSTP